LTVDRPDAAAQEALAARIRRPVTFCYLDILGDVLRLTDAPYSFAFAGTGDEDLDGHVFEALDPQMVSVGPVKAKEGGNDTVTLRLSGMIGVDSQLLNQLGDKSAWQGRDARLWKAMLHPDSLTQIGSIWPYYTGYMSVPKIIGDQASQMISLDLESYLAFFSQATNRTYLDQVQYDPGDKSAELAIAIANGAAQPK
jgi:hypothetical protein